MTEDIKVASPCGSRENRLAVRRIARDVAVQYHALSRVICSERLPSFEQEQAIAAFDMLDAAITTLKTISGGKV
jgi:hypothetical protein